jgi:hypothetical protein
MFTRDFNSWGFIVLSRLPIRCHDAEATNIGFIWFAIASYRQKIFLRALGWPLPRQGHVSRPIAFPETYCSKLERFFASMGAPATTLVDLNVRIFLDVERRLAIIISGHDVDTTYHAIGGVVKHDEARQILMHCR